MTEPLRAHNFCYGRGCKNHREHGSAYCASCARKIIANLGVLAGLGPVPEQLEFQEPLNKRIPKFSTPKVPSLTEQE